MTAILAKVKVRESNRNEFLKTMNQVAYYTQRERGCIQYEIYVHPENDCTFSFFGLWASTSDLKKHLLSDQFSLMLVAFKLLQKSPEIFYFQHYVQVGLKELIQFRE